MPGKPLHIAVGVIFSSKRDRVLVAMRPENVHQGGLWEFPGGKCREGEEVTRALKRELFEELNLRVAQCRPLIIIDHEYTEQSVKLDVWSVLDWHGDIFGKEGQRIEWVPLAELAQRDFPEANKRIIQAITSP